MRQGVGEGLSAMRERGLDDRPDKIEAGAWVALERDDRGVDTRSRTECRRRHPMGAELPRVELEKHRHGAVRLRPRRREEALGNLALHHHDPTLERRDSIEALDDDRRRDVVGQVRDELRRRRLERHVVEGDRVPEDEVDVRRPVERLLERLLERRIELDRMDLAHAVREVAGQHAGAGADLQDDVLRLELGEPVDHTKEVLVDEEVLPERLLRPRPHGRRKAREAFSSVWAAKAAAATSRTSASAATVCTRFAGSLGRPRTGCGLRYGLSVSTSSRSSGTSRAACRRSSAFVYVTLPANET